MLVRCKKNKGFQLPDSYIDLGYTKHTKFDLNLGQNYIVIGMSCYVGHVKYLLFGEDQDPCFYPKELFEVVDGKVPVNWEFISYNELDSKLQAIWGYPLLVEDERHYDGLVNGDEDARWIAKKELQSEIAILQSRSGEKHIE